MKNVKSIEEYSMVMDKIHSIKNDIYYTELSDDERTTLANSLIDMNEKTIKVLKDKFEGLGYREIKTRNKCCVSAKNDWVNVYVYSCTDEWFAVIASGGYKCDQIDGVLQLIDDIQRCIE